MRGLLLVALAALVVTAAATADPLDPKVAFNAVDQSIAKAAVLRQNDLGSGWTNRSAAEPSSLKAPICPSLRPDFSKLTLTGHAESVFENGNGGVQVVADAEVWASRAMATKHMAALMKPALPKCIRYSFLKSPGGSKLLLFDVKQTKLPKLADVSVAYRAPVGYKIGGKTFLVTSDFIFIRKGRTEIYINVTGPSSSEAQLTLLGTRLARTLAARARG
jgi:hypothetical protein